jgi:hypothetical protein
VIPPYESGGTTKRVEIFQLSPWDEIFSMSDGATWKTWLEASRRVLKDIFYGMTVYEMVRELDIERAHHERLFVLITMGDLFGVPILPPYYALRLLPYAVPNLEAWRRSMLRERDVFDLMDFET